VSFLNTLSKSFCAAALALTGTSAEAQQKSAPDTTGIAAFRAEMAGTPLGAQMLRNADATYMEMYYDSTLATRKSAWGLYSAETNTLWIMTNLHPDERAIAGSHELHHGEQQEFINYYGLRQTFMPPSWQYTLCRYTEADAMAFSTYEWALRMGSEKGAEKMPPMSLIEEYTLASYIRKQMDGDGFSLDEYRDDILMTCFGSIAKKQYNETHFMAAQSVNETLEDQANKADSLLAAGKRMQAIGALMAIDNGLALMPDTAKFEGILRRFGNVSLRRDGETALQDTAKTDRKTLFDVYPYLTDAFAPSGIYPEGPPAPETMQKLDKEYFALRERLSAIARKAEWKGKVL
jgi:hypothetical protein